MQEIERLKALLFETTMQRDTAVEQVQHLKAEAEAEAGAGKRMGAGTGTKARTEIESPGSPQDVTLSEVRHAQ